mmetsp:Transcript_11029/g.18291  ORF Transcript_11029/g.18291 Transcript_11029/m.18291 type:complete len:201 (+) Transcript_11029:77-679(+)|eukprot:CAMPEP_0119003422 /NCGR_PEP_ID=MMETSP1176-20130426/552_1 /TAXON_ID=265551 /ORGANISM="Synedropsis recta cf, Strain CCMP1620" /LENGTH=200 /DNA_ID=CAMNT_0006955023 /DNA_START=70 /DNA_END=672 /DNA_ORIENTATION=+
MSSCGLRLLCLYSLLGFAQANTVRQLTQSKDFVVVIGVESAFEEGEAPKICPDKEREAIQREVRYFIRKRAREYMNVVVDLKQDIKEDRDFLQDKNADPRARRRKGRNMRQRQKQVVVHPWVGRGEFDCTHCDSHGDSGLRKEQPQLEGNNFDSRNFEAFMDTQLSQDIQWVVIALRERQEMSLECLGNAESVKVSFELN